MEIVNYHLSGGTDENQEKFHSLFLVFWSYSSQVACISERNLYRVETAVLFVLSIWTSVVQLRSGQTLQEGNVWLWILELHVYCDMADYTYCWIDRSDIGS